MTPPHAAVVSNLFGTEAEADAHLAYWDVRAAAGIGWVDGITGIIDSLVPRGFDPSGIGARVHGVFRTPVFHERASRYAEVVHRHGSLATAQLIHQGGMPHGASAVQSSDISHQMPHVLNPDEIAWFVAEYAYSARACKEAGLDGVELHANNDDIFEWFLSPRTNMRSDRFGGSRENRARFLTDTIAAIRAEVGDEFVVGVRLTMDERIEDGYGVDEAAALAVLLEQHGVDYIHGCVGSPWGNPGYIPPAHWPEAAFAPLAGEIRRHVDIPVVYTGRVTTPAAAEAILVAEHADVVGIARAVLADPDFASKAFEARDEEVRRCIGCNECIHRVQAEGIPFACSVNPEAGREHLRPVVLVHRAPARGRLLVVGGGPAGLSVAVHAAELGMDVELSERAQELGGQIRVAARGPGQQDLLAYVEYQQRRLTELGVEVRLDTEVGVERILDGGHDALVIATGAVSRRPPIAGLDAPDVAHVHDAREVLLGAEVAGRRVVVISQDDHIAPLSVALLLAERGLDVHIVCQTNGPSPLLGKHTLGTLLARLSEHDVRWTFMEHAVAVQAGVLETRNVYSRRAGAPIAFDSLVLACGSESNTALATALREQGIKHHVIGDAFAPRRISFATRQGYLLAEQLAGVPC